MTEIPQQTSGPWNYLTIGVHIVGGAKVYDVAEDQEFYIELGKFITTYSLVEGMCAYCLRSISGLADEEARVVFGGLGLQSIVEKLAALARRRSDAEEISTLIRQVSSISKVRNDLLHRTMTFSPDGVATVTNVMMAKKVTSPDLTHVDRVALASMEQDCVRIVTRFSLVLFPQLMQSLESLRDDIYRPWQYVPAPP